MKEFQVVSGTLRVSDPCYDKKTWCSGTITVKSGKWLAEIKEDKAEGRVAELIIRHEDAKKLLDFDWESEEFEVGVDSGQAGFFDDKFYQKDESVKGMDASFIPEEIWYSVCCGITQGESFGVIQYGAVSSSGYGDGGYTCLTAKNKDGEVIAAKIVFIDSETEEDDDEHDCSECDDCGCCDCSCLDGDDCEDCGCCDE